MANDIELYRIKNQMKKNDMTTIPVFNSIYAKDGKLIGRLKGSGKELIIEKRK